MSRMMVRLSFLNLATAKPANCRPCFGSINLISLEASRLLITTGMIASLCAGIYRCLAVRTIGDLESELIRGTERRESKIATLSLKSRITP